MISWLNAFGLVVRQHIMVGCVAGQSCSLNGNWAAKEREKT
jgi:hypothetical protein